MLAQKIEMIKEQFNDILQGMRATYNYSLDLFVIENQNGGNPTIYVVFNGIINDIPYKEKHIDYRMASMTREAFFNEIKAYLFDVLDGVANL